MEYNEAKDLRNRIIIETAIRNAFSLIYDPDEECATQAAEATMYGQGIMDGENLIEKMMDQWILWYSGSRKG
jgi:hypothetical protein